MIRGVRFVNGLLASWVLVAMVLPVNSYAQSASIRFYELHKRDGEKRIRAKNSGEPGCHNLRGEKELHRVAMVGFSWCTVYSEPDCAPGSELSAMWAGSRYRLADIDVKEPQTRLMRGSRWEFTDKKIITDNDARKYQDTIRAENKKARLEALEEAREDLERSLRTVTTIDVDDGSTLTLRMEELEYNESRKNQKNSWFLSKEDEDDRTRFDRRKREEESERIEREELCRDFDEKNNSDDEADNDKTESKKSKRINREELRLRRLCSEDVLELSPEERVKKLEELEIEIEALEKDYIKGMQRNVLAASWYCEATE